MKRTAVPIPAGLSGAVQYLATMLYPTPLERKHVRKLFSAVAWLYGDMALVLGSPRHLKRRDVVAALDNTFVDRWDRRMLPALKVYYGELDILSAGTDEIARLIQEGDIEAGRDAARALWSTQGRNDVKREARARMLASYPHGHASLGINKHKDVKTYIEKNAFPGLAMAAGLTEHVNARGHQIPLYRLLTPIEGVAGFGWIESACNAAQEHAHCIERVLEPQPNWQLLVPKYVGPRK